MIFKVLQKQSVTFLCDIFIFIFEKLGSIGPLKLKIELVGPYDHLPFYIW